MFLQEFLNFKSRKPLVHVITNYVSMNSCANILLASGASPVMAEHSKEAEEITEKCDSLVINIGTLNEQKLEAMFVSGKKASEIGIPIVFDPVGVSASMYRLKAAKKILESVNVSVIRGNLSELSALITGERVGKGVDDFGESDNVNVENIAKKLALKYKCIVVCSGERDIVTDGNQVYIIYNGDKDMRRITGAGCMLSTVIGGYIGANYDQILTSTTLAVGLMGLCGEKSFKKAREKDEGSGSALVYLMDFFYKTDDKRILEELRIENH